MADFKFAFEIYIFDIYRIVVYYKQHTKLEYCLSNPSIQKKEDCKRTTDDDGYTNQISKGRQLEETFSTIPYVIHLNVGKSVLPETKICIYEFFKFKKNKTMHIAYPIQWITPHYTKRHTIL